MHIVRSSSVEHTYLRPTHSQKQLLKILKCELSGMLPTRLQPLIITDDLRDVRCKPDSIGPSHYWDRFRPLNTSLGLLAEL